MSSWDAVALRGVGPLHGGGGVSQGAMVAESGDMLCSLKKYRYLMTGVAARAGGLHTHGQIVSLHLIFLLMEIAAEKQNIHNQLYCSLLLSIKIGVPKTNIKLSRAGKADTLSA